MSIIVREAIAGYRVLECTELTNRTSFGRRIGRVHDKRARLLPLAFAATRLQKHCFALSPSHDLHLAS